MVKVKENKEVHFFGLDMARIVKLYMGILAKRLEHLDIDRYYFLLLIIDHSESPFTQQQLCHQLKIDKTVMVRIVDYLSKKGYLIREPNQEDRRSYFLTLTAKAKKDMPYIKAVVEELDQVATLNMNKSDVSSFCNALSKVKENLKNEPSHSMVVRYKKVK